MQDSAWDITDAPDCEPNASFSLREVLEFCEGIQAIPGVLLHSQWLDVVRS